jgi:hypothetical protein
MGLGIINLFKVRDRDRFTGNIEHFLVGHAGTYATIRAEAICSARCPMYSKA